MALVRELAALAESGAAWRDWYGFLPWEDWREGRPTVIDTAIIPALGEWAERRRFGGGAEARRERSQILFGLGRFDVGSASGSWSDTNSCGRSGSSRRPALEWSDEVGARGTPMVLDHRRIAAQALGRIRGKLRYRPVVFELVPETFTLTGLLRVVEALSGVRIHAQNFRRLVDRGGLVEKTGVFDTTTGGRPAEMYRFRREVLRERPAPGVGISRVSEPAGRPPDPGSSARPVPRRSTVDRSTDPQCLGPLG